MTDSVAVEELVTYLVCPRQYEFECVSALTGDDHRDGAAFRQILRETITAGISSGLEGDDPYEAAVSALDAAWDDYAEDIGHHSEQQEEAERNRARAAVDAYFDGVGRDHLDGVAEADDLCDFSVVGPDARLSAVIDGHRLTVDVDYVAVDRGRLAGVRLTDTFWGSSVPYANSTDILTDHFEQAEYRPRQVGAVLAARVVEEALADYGGDGVGAEFGYLSVMQTVFENADGCEAETDVRWMGDYLANDRDSVDDAIAWLCGNLQDEVYSPVALFDEQDHWSGSFELVSEYECRRCSYVAGCQEAIREDVMFNV